MAGEWPDLANRIQLAGQASLGESAVYAPAAGGSFSVRIQFRSAHEEIILEDGVPVSTVRTLAQVHLADFPAEPVQGDGLTARGTDYEVADIQPDGEGDAQLVLHEA